MTAEQKAQYRQEIEQVATTFGFRYSRIGCACSGSQLIYDTYHNGKHYELDVWHARGYWHLYEGTTKIAYATQPQYLHQQLQQLWDLSN